MSGLSPFRDINVTASEAHYTFRSPSTPDAPALVITRPSGDMRLADVPALGGKRVTSIAGILGIVRLKLGSSPSQSGLDSLGGLLAHRRQVRHHHH